MKKLKDFLKNLKLNEANVSMLLGIVVVIIVGALLINYFRSVNKPGTTSSTATTGTPDQAGITPKPVLADLPAEYTVQANDSLWSISQSVYTSGYNWSDVYAANKDVIGANPDNLLAGTKLTLPKMEPKEVTAPVVAKSVKHTVVKGDSLSHISFHLCGNAYLWSTVAKDNNIANPDVIEVGQELQINCP